MASPSYSVAVLADSPVSYWELSEASGSVLHDSLSLNPGTFSNVLLFQNQPAVGAPPSVYFNGTTSFAEIPTSSSLHPTSAITVEALVNSTNTSTATHAILEAGFTSNSSPSTNYGLYFNTNNTFEFSIAVASTQFHIFGGTFSTTSNTWYHVVGTYDGTTAKLYVNATLIFSQSVSGAILNSSQPLDIARTNRGGTTGNFFTGYLSGIALYSTALTLTQITNHYNSLTVPFTSVLPAYSSQIQKEILYIPSQKARTSQLQKEIIYSPSPIAHTSQLIKEVIYPTPAAASAPPSSSAVSTQIVVETLRDA